jgi:hypothetical protein
MSVKELPGITGLSEQQVRGKACVWCGVTSENGKAIDLGQRPAQFAGSQVSRFPRGCCPCAKSNAEQELAAHLETCRTCNTRGGVCSTGNDVQAILGQAQGRTR